MTGMFTRDRCISHSGTEAKDFVKDVLLQSEKALFIGTVGLDSASLYYPLLLAASPQVEFGFVIEQRPSVQPELLMVGERHQNHLLTALGGSRVQFAKIDVVAKDGATIAGRRALDAAGNWLKAGYSDIVVDATGMSRGTCFPIVRQALKIAMQSGANMHLLVASNRKRTLDIKSEANDRADWVHGFQ